MANYVWQGARRLRFRSGHFLEIKKNQTTQRWNEYYFSIYEGDKLIRRILTDDVSYFEFADKKKV